MFIIKKMFDQKDFKALIAFKVKRNHLTLIKNDSNNLIKRAKIIS